MNPDKPKKPRGFAAMHPDIQREIASKGGRAVHAKGTGHEWTSDEARIAGRIGGRAWPKRRRKVFRKGDV